MQHLKSPCVPHSSVTLWKQTCSNSSWSGKNLLSAGFSFKNLCHHFQGVGYGEKSSPWRPGTFSVLILFFYFFKEEQIVFWNGFGPIWICVFLNQVKKHYTLFQKVAKATHLKSVPPFVPVIQFYKTLFFFTKFKVLVRKDTVYHYKITFFLQIVSLNHIPKAETRLVS